MAQSSVVVEIYGIGTKLVSGSFRSNGAAAITSAVIRDGKSAIVASVARSAAGVYTVTFNKKLGKDVYLANPSLAGTPAAATYGGDASYNNTTKVLTLRFWDAAGAAKDPDAGVRIGFFGVFTENSSLQES